MTKQSNLASNYSQHYTKMASKFLNHTRNLQITDGTQRPGIEEHTHKRRRSLTPHWNLNLFDKLKKIVNLQRVRFNWRSHEPN